MKNSPTTLTEFDEKLWAMSIDSVTVHRDRRLEFRFRDARRLRVKWNKNATCYVQVKNLGSEINLAYRGLLWMRLINVQNLDYYDSTHFGELRLENAYS